MHELDEALSLQKQAEDELTPANDSMYVRSTAGLQVKELAVSRL
jgi:hypothetical protein